jgi:hypothetical protein
MDLGLLIVRHPLFGFVHLPAPVDPTTSKSQDDSHGYPADI